MRIDEPTFDVQTAGRWDLHKNALELGKTKVTCPSVRIDADQFALDMNPLVVRGVAAISGDLARLRNWTRDPAVLPAPPVQGTLAGKVELQSSGDRYAASFNLALKN